MGNLKTLKHMEIIEKELEKLYKVEKEKRILQNECEHEIIILLKCYNGGAVDAECLFCGKKYESNRSLYGKGIIIDISDYVFLDDKMKVIRDIYKEIVFKNPGIELEEISVKLEEEIDKIGVKYS